MTEHEIQRMVVRLIGDGSSYFRMLQGAAKETAKTQSLVASAAKKIEATGKALKSFGGSMKSVGRQMTMAITAPLVALQALTIKVGSDFESGFAGVRKTVDATEQEFAVLRQGFKDMANEIPVSTTQLLSMGEAAGQLGIKTGNILDFTKTMAMLTASTNLTAEEGASDMAKFANIMDMPQEQFSNLGSSLVALGNNFSTTERDILEMSKRLAGAGKTMGLVPHQVTGIATALSALGMEAEAGGSAMSQFMLRTTKAVALGGKSLEGLAKTAGMSSNEFKQVWEKDTVGALQAVIGGLSNLDKNARSVALKQMGIDGIRMADEFLRLSNKTEMLTDALAMSKKAFEENTALAEGAARRFETFESQVIILKNQLYDLLEGAFKLMRPSLVAIIDKLKEGIIWLKSWSPEAKIMAINIMKVTAVIGPLLAALGTLVVIMGHVISAGGVIIGVLGAITAPMWAVYAAVAALVAALAAATYWLVGPEGLANAFNIFAARVQNSIGVAVGFMQNFRDNVRVLAAWVVQNWQSMAGDLGEIWGLFVVMWIDNLFVGVETVIRIMTVMAGWLKGLWERIFSIDFVNAIIQGVIAGAKAIGSFATRAAKAIRDALLGRGVDMGAFLKQMEGDFKKGAEDINPLGALQDVLKEQMAKVSLGPLEGFTPQTAMPQLNLGGVGDVPRNALADQSVVSAISTPLQASLQPNSPQMQAVDNLKSMAVEKTNVTLDKISTGISELVRIGNEQLKNPTLDIESAGLR